MEIERILTVASSVSSPLGLGGLFAAVLFLLLRQILQKDFFPRLAQTHTAQVLTLIIERLFVLALIAMILGFVAYLVPALLGRPVVVSQSPQSLANPPSSRDTRTLAGTGAVYNGCEGEKIVEIYICMGTNGEQGGVKFTIPPGQTRHFAVEKGSTYRYNCDGPVNTQCPSPGAWVPIVATN